jgi:hypothetical protein
MTHNVPVTDHRSGAWQRLDTEAVTPTTLHPPRPQDDHRSPVRMRRSRRPVLNALDGGGDVLQRRMRDVAIGSTVILVPAVALNLWMTTLAFDNFDNDDSLLPGVSSADINTGVEDVATLLATVFVSFVTAVVGYLCALILIGDRFSAPIDLPRALRRTLRHLPRIAAAWILGHFWLPIMVAWIVTGESADVGPRVTLFLTVAFLLTPVTLLVVPAMAGESIGAVASLKRSWRLARLRPGACIGFVLLATFLGGLLLVGIGTLAPLLELGGFITFGSWTWLVQGVMVQLAVLFVVPWVALGTAQLYIEVRLDAEGMDLVIDADGAFGPRFTPDIPADAQRAEPT